MRATLPRRLSLGARLAADEAAVFSTAGARVSGVMAGGLASDAGVRAGDLLVHVGGAPVRSIGELATALRAAQAPEVELGLVRDGVAITCTAARREVPREAVAGARVVYDHLDVPGARLRTIVTTPLDAPPIAAILVLQGIACESIEAGGDAPLPRLVHGWAAAGVMTMRVERRGVGDSEGGPCGAVDLATDLEDQRAALRALAAASDARRVLFGHSVGGMTAARLAAEHPDLVDGVIVYGTSPVTWLDCVAASTRRQLAQRGVDEPAIARHLTDLRARILRDGASGRSGAYHAQLDALELAAAWRAVTAPTLVLHGEHDWVVGTDEAVRIVALAGATMRDLPGLDHLLGWHASREASMREYGAGRFDPAIVDATLGWLSVGSLA